MRVNLSLGQKTHGFPRISRKKLSWNRELAGLREGKGKCTGKIHPLTVHEGPKVECRYSCTLSLPSALHGIGKSKPRPGRFTPGKDPATFV
jgi:hypothetical protein